MPRRVALVVGNGAYAANPLPNPPNDAVDIAAALKDAGFEVTLVTDADLAAFDQAVSSFASRLGGAETGLFYYAGHGVAVDGRNYLIPVSPRIDEAPGVKAKSVALDTVVGRMEQSGVRTVLVFLDSCRDNPFPGASRSGTRGLAVVDTPASFNSMIAYATSPGDTAADGTSRNGVFTGALLAQLAMPGQELAELMRNVSADVAKSTGGRQQPRADYGMKESFYFVSPETLASRARDALEANRAELVRLEKELVARQAMISAAKDTRDRQALEVEQQRQQALALAKRIETENLAREADKQNTLALEASAAAAMKTAAAAAQSRQQAELAELAAARRAELERLAAAAASDNPDILIETVERLEAVLREVDGQYTAVLTASLASTKAGFDKQLASLSGRKPDITETDAEFNARMAREKAGLESRRQDELARLYSDAEARHTTQTKAMRTQFDDTLNTLQTKLWTITGSAVKLTIGEFDRNTRLWPFSVASLDPLVPMIPVQLEADLNRAADPKAAILALDSAVKAGALIAEIDWGITREPDRKRYTVDVRAVRVRNLATDQVAANVRLDQHTAYFTAGKRSSPTAARGTLQVLSASGVADVYIDGQLKGRTPFNAVVAEGSYEIEVKWADRYIKAFKKPIVVNLGSIASVVAIQAVYKVGDTGPAGGIIFYDKGKSTDGWRFLEAAPSDQDKGIQWNEGLYVEIATATAIGTGKANTNTIIAEQGSGNYAATLCRDLSLGGFNDWFLPSKDELHLMYVNLKKAGLGGLGGYYWSSSSNRDRAWGHNFHDGFQSVNSKENKGAVRAIRAF